MAAEKTDCLGASKVGATVINNPEKEEEDSVRTADDEPDAFGKIIARIKQDISQNASRRGRSRAPKSARHEASASPSMMDPMVYVTGSRDRPGSDFNNYDASSRVSSASAPDSKQGIRTKIRSAKVVNLPAWRTFSSRDRSFWECKTPFVFTGSRKRNKIKRIEEESEADVTEEGIHVTKGEFDVISHLSRCQPLAGIHFTFIFFFFFFFFFLFLFFLLSFCCYCCCCFA